MVMGQNASELSYAVPPFVWYMFMSFLVAGSVLAFVGTVWKTCLWSLIAEMVGLSIAIIGLSVFAYDRTVVIIHQLDLVPRWVDVINIVIFVSLGVVMAHRRFQVSHLLRAARKL